MVSLVALVADKHVFIVVVTEAAFTFKLVFPGELRTRYAFC
jgi:hypothetical protein